MSSEVKPAVEAAVAEKLQEYLLENPGEARAITGKIDDVSSCPRGRAPRLRDDPA